MDYRVCESDGPAEVVAPAHPLRQAQCERVSLSPMAKAPLTMPKGDASLLAIHLSSYHDRDSKTCPYDTFIHSQTGNSNSWRLLMLVSCLGVSGPGTCQYPRHPGHNSRQREGDYCSDADRSTYANPKTNDYANTHSHTYTYPHAYTSPYTNDD